MTLIKDCLKIGDNYYSLADIEDKVFKSRILPIVPEDLEVVTE